MTAIPRFYDAEFDHVEIHFRARATTAIDADVKVYAVMTPRDAIKFLEAELKKASNPTSNQEENGLTLINRMTLAGEQRFFDDAVLDDAIAEIESLRRFKAEATTLLEMMRELSASTEWYTYEKQLAEFLAKHKAAG